jgi:hypothetical protein
MHKNRNKFILITFTNISNFISFIVIYEQYFRRIFQFSTFKYDFISKHKRNIKHKNRKKKKYKQ